MARMKLAGLLVLVPLLPAMVDIPARLQAVTPAQVALGDSVFRGKVGGALCYVCHGPAGKGIPGLGPNLADKEWLNADGTVESIARVIETGVAKPKKMPAPMPPKGGGQLTPAQIQAAAAFVYSLSHPTANPDWSR